MDDLKYLISDDNTESRGDESPTDWADETDIDEAKESTRSEKLCKNRKLEDRQRRIKLKDFLQQTCFDAVLKLLQGVKSKMDSLTVSTLVCSNLD